MGKIKIKEENKGKFSEWAKARGMSVQAAAAMVLRNREKYSPALIKRANFARNAAKWEEGGMIQYSKGGLLTGVATIGVGDMKIKKGKETLDDIASYSLGGNIAKTIGGVGIGVAGVLASPFTGGTSLTMIPAGANMAMEGVQGFSDDAKAKKDSINNIQNMGAAQQDAVGSSYVPTFKTGGRFKGKKFGYKPGEQNAIVGGDELVITPDNVVTRMKGPTDENGGQGIDTQLPNNTRIINRRDSKRLLPLVSKMNKDREVLSGNATRLAKNSAERNLNKRLAKVNNVYNEQELAKFDGGGGYKLKLNGSPGGYTNSWTNNSLFKEKYQIPSVLDDAHEGMSNWVLPDGNAYGVSNNMPENNVYAPTTTRDVIYAPPAHGEYDHLGANLRKTGLINKPDVTPNKLAPGPKLGEASPSTGMNWGEAATLVGEMAPTLFNLFSRKAKGIDERRYKNWNEGEIRSKLANRRYNIDPELAANEAAFRTTASNMRGLGGSRGQVMSNVTGAQNVKQFGDMAAWSKKNNMDNQYRGEEANMLYGMGRDDLSGRIAHDEAEAMDYASWYNNKGSAMTGVQNYLLQRRLMKNQMAQSQLLANAIKAYGSGYAGKWVPGIDDYITGQNRKLRS